MVAASSLTIELIPQCALIGKNVTLSVSEINGMLKSFSWYLGDAPSASNQIINYLVGLTPPTTNGPKHFTDAIGLPNGSLLITNLKEEYSNTYTVQVQADSPDRASADLIVTSEDQCQDQGKTGQIISLLKLPAMLLDLFLDFTYRSPG
ncbi:carcinoembryonic antigen-related cell adhesion molecule 8-like [Xenopus laevis]|uniref:Carcinoembryonic antigen-related cell adhesion molecule 8-like n=1 Tax=Xenopus laevis TaxID=8355 RepID=A0A8J1LES8_XENLA|nr:carcinoembryonic antigen-related cell adhesion molecule 8-like [Xenopus laevis]